MRYPCRSIEWAAGSLYKRNLSVRRICYIILREVIVCVQMRGILPLPEWLTRRAAESLLIITRAVRSLRRLTLI